MENEECRVPSDTSRMTNRADLFQRIEQTARADGKDAYFRLHRHRYALTLAALDAPPGPCA